MVFSSTTFLFVFLPIVLLVVYPLRRVWQNVALLVLSVAFYLWGAGSDIVYITFVSLASWFLALFLAERRGWSGRVLYFVSIVLVVSPLVLVKYVPVIAQVASIDSVFAQVSLPLGISFFTFHGLSYVMDVRRGDQPRETRLDHYLLYLFLFPHQIAGPIVRYGEIREEIKSRLRPRTQDVVYGLSRFGWGLFKKVAIADQCGAVAAVVFDSGGTKTAAEAWIGAFAFTVQIYFDFSGYSDMAIGLARVFNFHFPENFAGPYRSVSATEFWRRWHMTLSRWFRDYVYIPLGGNRHGPFREYAALLVTFGLTSLWHGATWPYLVWGGLWSSALMVERLTGLRSVTGFVALRRALMALFIIVTWVPFRSPTMTQTVELWKAMVVGQWSWPGPALLVALTPLTLAALAVGVLIFFLPDAGPRRIFDRIIQRGDTQQINVRVTVAIGTAALIVGVIMALWGSFSPFLYFQF
ncbi:MAG: MBOAT family O-acyltransferase [Candidatus Nanopelagicales bacterium]